ncbi:tripartite motif-containing protein 65 isoform X1 [Coturnix japonica]|uniref:tripartite motif-containing protein 65 isoform X1 n=1 Tax=Coturnix japonica TaxID=93934 RepID=UPI000776E11A|nr:tripartite motif-containing protein 65 isoform X1 [Coturnix japonica]
MASPTSEKLEDKLLCSICLELFVVPITLPCGHNFCEHCIDNHRNKQEQAVNGPKRGYTCPTCRYSCEQHLELKKNVTLSDVVELARTGRVQAGGCEVAHVGLCSLHGRPLELYCEDEQRCICCVCVVRRCQQHRTALFEDVRSRKQAQLERSLEEAQREAERMEQALRELEERAQSIEDSSERLQAVILSKFTHLEEALAKFREQMVAKVKQEESVAMGHIEKDRNALKDHLEALGQHRDQAQHLMDCTDHQTFLKEFLQLPTLQSMEVPPLVEFNVAVVMEPMSEILTATSRLLLEELPASLSPSAPEAPDPIAPGPVQPEETPMKVVSSPVPKCRLRAELLKDHRNLTFDPDTANKYLELSCAQRRAKHGPSTAAGWQERSHRFEPWQVLCVQSYGQGRHYWEVTISSHSVVLGVTYGGLSRHKVKGCKFNIGLDGGSWGLQVREDSYVARHKGQEEKIQLRPYTELGVCLDYECGLLSFYGLGEEVQLIHSFHTVFTEPLFPVFWLCEGRTITLCHRDCEGNDGELGL